MLIYIVMFKPCRGSLSSEHRVIQAFAYKEKADELMREKNTVYLQAKGGSYYVVQTELT